MNVAGGVSEGNPRKKEWHAFGGTAVRCAREEGTQVVSDMSVSVPRPPMSSQGDGKAGWRRMLCTSTAACGATGCGCHYDGCNGTQCVQQSVICIFLPAELAGAARRCRRPLVIGLLRPFFLSAQREKQLFLHVTCWYASILPTGCHAAVSLQCSSRVPHCTRSPLSCLFCRAIACGPQLGGCSLFK
ncbi:hypothetical protein TcG_10693 [Trypanosoma cruzi]|nr:hypothetical protein TcG_10693 [Trypanosoma cruzi]